MQILRHGKRPEKQKLYFQCYKCQCVYVAEASECEYHDAEYQPDCGYSLNCPECGAKNFGNTRVTFHRYEIP